MSCPGCQTGHAYSRCGWTKEAYVRKEWDGRTLNLFKSLRRDMDALALWTISLTWISHFKVEENVTPSTLKEEIEISGG